MHVRRVGRQHRVDDEQMVDGGIAVRAAERAAEAFEVARAEPSRGLDPVTVRAGAAGDEQVQLTAAGSDVRRRDQTSARFAYLGGRLVFGDKNQH